MNILLLISRTKQIVMSDDFLIPVLTFLIKNITIIQLILCAN